MEPTDIDSIAIRVDALERSQDAAAQIDTQQQALIQSLSEVIGQLATEKQAAKAEASFSQKLMAVLSLTVILAVFSVDPNATRFKSDGAEIGLREVPWWAATGYALAIAVVVLNQEQTDRGIAVLASIRGLAVIHKGNS